MARKADISKRLTADEAARARKAEEGKLFFNQAFGSGGLGGSPSAFTSPGMNPQMLAQLMAMGGAGAAPGAMAPQMPATPANATGNNATPSMFPTPPQIPSQSGLLQALQGLGNNPQLMQRILAMLSAGGNTTAGALPGSPNNWVPGAAGFAGGLPGAAGGVPDPRYG